VLILMVIGKRRIPSEALHTVLHGIVPLIAACSYLAMATGQGPITLPAAGMALGRLAVLARVGGRVDRPHGAAAAGAPAPSLQGALA